MAMFPLCRTIISREISDLTDLRCTHACYNQCLDCFIDIWDIEFISQIFSESFKVKFSPYYEDLQNPNKQNQSMDLFRTECYSKAGVKLTNIFGPTIRPTM